MSDTEPSLPTDASDPAAPTDTAGSGGITGTAAAGTTPATGTAPHGRPDSAEAATTSVDLVLEGGGVKGIGLAGAVQRLAELDYRFERVAGTSAGAITAAVVAAMRQRGEAMDRIDDIALTLDYGKFRDRGPIARMAGPLRPVFDAANLMFDSGIYEGDYLRDWLAGVLAEFGIRTFGDLRLPEDPGSGLPDSHRYRAVMVASDVSRKRAIKLPWDYPEYGLDPDEQSVAEAARMSASIPFYFEPVMLGSDGAARSTIVDGAVFSNFPITVFDRTDGEPPRWPTFGVRLSGRAAARPRTQVVEGPVSLAFALAESMFGAWDAMYLDEPCTTSRTIFVDTSGVSAVDFDISRERQRELLLAGRGGTEEFLATWDFEEYLKRCRGGEQ